MEPWQTFVLGLCEYLAWPITVILCVIVFEKDIKKVLLRLKKLPGGTELDSKEIEDQEESKNIFNDVLLQKIKENRIKLEKELNEATEQNQTKEAK